jgi:hypothetical protein
MQRVRIAPIDDDHLATVAIDHEPATATILNTFKDKPARARRALEVVFRHTC